ncbi:ATP-dependent RNA helicase DDX4 isoform X1 [Octopus bimaculoides]|uniref:ATP-dependent RNA helicase DDX4 isoform X1 n=1 Tax=Octopus bimaculoides TaxID=37653 RepID=UPI0022E20F3F|nr:ATP-dependent RNA helicase DDX4 isoform X1 [Octopus bimaculoides]
MKRKTRGRGRGLAFLDFNENDQVTKHSIPPPSSGQFNDECWDDDYSVNNNVTNGNCDNSSPLSNATFYNNVAMNSHSDSVPKKFWRPDQQRKQPGCRGFRNLNAGRRRDSPSPSINNSEEDWNSDAEQENKYHSRKEFKFSSGRDQGDSNQSRPGNGARYKSGNAGCNVRNASRFNVSSCKGSDAFDKVPDHMTLGDAQGGEAPYIPPPPPEDESAIFQSIPTGINFAKYDDIPVEISGRAAPNGLVDFEEAQFQQKIMENIYRAKFEKPTPIQKNAIPIIQAGRDLMACAQTGSGKTAAFLLPVLTLLLQRGVKRCEQNLPQYPEILIVAPTRELAVQIFMDTRKFAYGTSIRSAVVYGGTSVSSQIKNISFGVHVLVGTPGRLLDFIHKNTVNISQVKHFILDEADRMLDMGFEPDIRRLVDDHGMPAKTQRQTLMFSATFPDKIQELAADFLNDYLFLTIGLVGGACSDVEQILLKVSRQEKREKLCSFLDEFGSDKTLVFVEQKRNADFLASYLSQNDYKTTSIHGDRLQREREEALQDFKTGRIPVLIATSVAARGLDIPNVSQVVNYDLPSSVDEYVHRIGRTGRCGNTGRAISFYSSDSDSCLAKALTKILSDAQQNVPVWLEEEAKMVGLSNGTYSSGRFGGRDRRRIRSCAPEMVNDGCGWQPISSGAPPRQAIEEEELWE